MYWSLNLSFMDFPHSKSLKVLFSQVPIPTRNHDLEYVYNSSSPARVTYSRQPELGGLMNCSHWSTKSDQFSKPYLDLPSFFIKFAMFVTSFAGSVSASERDQQNTKLTQKILCKNRAKQYKKFHVVLTTFL